MDALELRWILQFHLAKNAAMDILSQEPDAIASSRRPRTNLRIGAGAMNELVQVLEGNSAAAPPANILEGLSSEIAHRTVDGSPRTIYEELWHIAYWQQMTLDWVRGIETPYPEHASEGFPTADAVVRESWQELCDRFFHTNRAAVKAAQDWSRIDLQIHCPSPAGR